MHGAKVSASLGVPSVPSTSANSVGLVKAADTALYKAKHVGENQVALALLRPNWREQATGAGIKVVPLQMAAE